MKYLLDTHAIFWAISAPDKHKLSVVAKKLIEDKANQLVVSNVTLFEFTIKHALKKLSYNGDLRKLFDDINIFGAEVIYPTTDDYIMYSLLPFHHRDPFDRLIIAQAKQNNLPLISKDESFRQYGINIIW